MRSVTSLFAAFVLVLIASSSAQAAIDIQATDYIFIENGLGSSGGVFDVQETNAAHTLLFGDEFPTFCVEISENINPPGTYYVEALSNTADQSGNVLTDLAGTIYAEFLAGTLPHMEVSAKFNNSVQLAIWTEVIAGSTPASLASFIGTYDLSWYNDILAISATPFHGVQIMNLRSSSASNANYNQDLLVRNTPPSTQIPEATAMLTWGLIMISAGFASRRVRAVV